MSRSISSAISGTAAQSKSACLTPALIQRLSVFLREMTGLCIDAEKQYLLESKLGPIVVRERLPSYAALVDSIERDKSSQLAQQVAQAMTINETHFFRDRVPFATLKDLMPQILTSRARERSLRIWSAACSTGQELYSISMVVDEFATSLTGWKIDLVGTDVSEPVLVKARKGAYSQFEVQRGLPAPMLLKHFTRVGDEWVITDRLRRQVTFHRLNLLDNVAALGVFDLIFCRNVLFYFEPATRSRVLSKIAGVLRPGGHVVLGTSEAMTALAAGFRPGAPGSCYYGRATTASALSVKSA